MLVLAIGSKAETLSLIWSTSLTLAFASVLILLILILRRFWQEFISARREGRKKELAQYIRAALINPAVITENALPPLMIGDEEVVCHAALDILRTVRGEDEKNITKLLKEWDVVRYLEKTLKKGSRGKKIQALTILANFDDDESLEYLLEYMKSKDIYVQLAALRGLAIRNAIAELPTIIAYLKKSKQRNILMLADILQRFGADSAKHLGALATSDAILEARVAAIIALGNISSLKSIPILIKLANDNDSEIAAYAIKSLGKIGDMAAEKIILKSLDAKNEKVRIQAIRAVGYMGLEKAIIKLSENLSDKNWWVRFRAAEALAMMGNKGSLVLKATQNQKGIAGKIAKEMLQEKGLVSV